MHLEEHLMTFEQEQELGFYGIHPIEFDGRNWVDIDDAVILLQLLNASQLAAATAEAAYERAIVSLDIMAKVVETLSDALDTLDERFGAIPGIALILKTTEQKLDTYEEVVDNLLDHGTPQPLETETND